MKQIFRNGGRLHEIDLSPSGSGYRARSGGSEGMVAVRDCGGGRLEITLDGRSVVVHSASDGNRRWVALGGRTYELQLEIARHGSRRSEVETSDGKMRAPMPGQVREVRVSAGEEIAAGQVLLLLEAMKMEIRIQSPVDGTVITLPVTVGEQVEKDQVLIEIR